MYIKYSFLQGYHKAPQQQAYQQQHVQDHRQPQQYQQQAAQQHVQKQARLTKILLFIIALRVLPVVVT